VKGLKVQVSGEKRAKSRMADSSVLASAPESILSLMIEKIRNYDNFEVVAASED
jgi:hypothetical protein